MHTDREEHCLLEYRALLSTRRNRIAEHWYGVIAHQAFSPFAESEILAGLRALVEQAIAILTDSDYAADAGEEIGTALVHFRYLDPVSLRQTIAVLGEELGKDFPAPLGAVLRARLPALLGAIAAGHEEAGRVRVLDEQEGIRAATLTERERITAALYESEARFRAIFANAGMGITLASLDGHAIECNPAVERILGYNRAELARMRFADITHPDDLAEDLMLYEGLVAGKRSSYYKEKRYWHKHGHIVRCNLTASLLRDAQGNPQYVLGMLEDITSPRSSSTDAPDTQYPITERERGVLQQLAEGLTQEQIANRGGMSVRTVKRIVAALHEKLNAPSPVALGAQAVRLGLMPPRHGP